MAEAPIAPEDASGAKVAIWASIDDGEPRQVIFYGEVDFLLYPKWFLCGGHKLANVPCTKDTPRPCGAERSEVMRNALHMVDWRSQNLQAKVQKPFLTDTDSSMYVLRMKNFGVETLKVLNQELMASGRRRSSGCEISDLNHLKKAPSICYTDGRGFMLGEHVLRGCNVEMPFHPTIYDLLAVMNMCLVQVSANGWRILLGFIAKCQRDGVVATAGLFLYFFYAR